jgi:hypothetical protein
MRRGLTIAKYIQSIEEIENQATYYNLKNDLVDHLRALKGLNNF